MFVYPQQAHGLYPHCTVPRRQSLDPQVCVCKFFLGILSIWDKGISSTPRTCSLLLSLVLLTIRPFSSGTGNRDNALQLSLATPIMSCARSSTQRRISSSLLRSIKLSASGISLVCFFCVCGFVTVVTSGSITVEKLLSERVSKHTLVSTCESLSYVHWLLFLTGLRQKNTAPTYSMDDPMGLRQPERMFGDDANVRFVLEG